MLSTVAFLLVIVLLLIMDVNYASYLVKHKPGKALKRGKKNDSVQGCPQIL